MFKKMSAGTRSLIALTTLAGLSAATVAIQVDLRRVAGNDDLGAGAHARQKHFHL